MSESSFAAVLERHLAAVRGRDLQGLGGTLHEDVAVLMLDGRLLRGRAAVGRLHADWFSDPDWTIGFTEVWRRVTDSSACMLLEVDYSDVTDTGEPFRTRYSLGLTFVRQDDTWLLMLDQNSPAPPA